MKESKTLNSFICRIFKLIRPYALHFTLGSVFLLLGSAVNLMLPQVARDFLDSETGNWALEHPFMTALALFVIFAGQNLFFYLRSSLFSDVGIRVGADLREQLFTALIKKPLAFHDTNSWMDIRSRLVSDIQLLQDAISLRLSVFLRYGIQVLIAAICMFFISMKLALLTVAVVPALGLLGALMGRRLKKLSSVSQQKLAVTNADAQEGLGQIRLVKLLSAESDFVRRFSVNNSASASSFLARARFAAAFSSSMNFLLTFAVAAVVLYGLSLVQDSSLSKGSFAAFSLYGVILAVSFGFAVSAYSELVQAMAAGERVFPLIESADYELRQAVKEKLSEAKAVQFKEVTFSYPSRPNQQIFSDMSFVIQPNKCTAIVGPSGSGKTTLINLLLGLYKPDSGQILIDSKQLDLLDLQKYVAVVPQDGFLISGTLRENLCLGSSQYQDSELKAVIHKVGLASLMDNLDLDSDLGERGGQLSGGQKQRLAIARALLKTPGLLILDEASSALDPESERMLVELINSLKQSCTIVLITHRVSSLAAADQILVFVKGKLVQSGPYSEVVKGQGIFRSMLDTELVEN